ncbi:MAG: lipoyl(octanoyl) transferase LipB [Alphaproteobacteria bacterium]|nr:lipoyl(octanoyl) transferase LipB [Alphaproteobacteria bacterium]
MGLAQKVAPTKKAVPAKTAAAKPVSAKRIPYKKVDWHIDDRPVPYDRALAFMEAKVGLIREKNENDYVWLLEHPPVYTAGTSADPKDLLDARFPVYNAGRGGQYTYHGPGQRVAYVMMDLQKRQRETGPDLRAYVHQLEQWAIETLSHFDVKGERRKDRVGIWIDMKKHGGKKGEEAKIAAIGVRVRKWVAFHGISLNVNPDLSHFAGIVPCGISQHGVTSLSALGIAAPMGEVDKALKLSWQKVFG